jgi:hypothetical protein
MTGSEKQLTPIVANHARRVIKYVTARQLATLIGNSCLIPYSDLPR